jgi:hypothetical protein
MILGVRTIFDLFLIKCHVNLRGWGYIFIAGKDSQAYADMLF